MTLSPRLAAFCRNDLEHAPFGIGFLRGLTPARLAVAAFVCLLIALIDQHPFLAQWPTARPEVRAFMVKVVWVFWMRNLLAAVPMVVMIIWVDRHTAGRSWKVRIGAFAAAVILGSMALAVIWTAYRVYFNQRSPFTPTIYWMIPVHFYRAALAGGVLSAVLFVAAREREAGRQLLKAQLARVAAERQIAEARLQLLRAQIEPHFLFNSLASVKHLYESDPRGGRKLLRNVTVYMRSAVARARDDRTTLREQVDLARSFLDIFRQRMGERLRVRIEVPQEVELALFPTLMLGTLVENAVKHGVGPKGEGGSIEIVARCDSGTLIVEVRDDGVGFAGESGTGVGLANTRARLASLYPDAGEVELRRNPAGGVTASIRIPLVFVAPRSELEPERLPGVPPDEVPRAGEGFFARFRRTLTWKHWAWAIGIGIVMGALDRLRTFHSPFDNFGAYIWTVETIQRVAAACLFMLAIVAAEASAPRTRASAAGRYAAGAFVATVICAGLMWLVGPLEQPMRKDHPEAARVAKFMSSPKQNKRVAMLFGASAVMIGHGVLGTLLYVWLRNAKQTAEALARAEIERAEAERRLIASQVEAVEAEVDPSFMFATLEAIESMYDRDRRAADAMLDELIAFLRAAIPRIRDERSPMEVAA